MRALDCIPNPSPIRTKASPSLLLPLMALMVLSALPHKAWSADGVGRYFQQMSAEQSVTRQVTLKELGITAPLIFTGADSRRELFLPVPAGVPVMNAALQFNASYLRADGGRTSMAIRLSHVNWRKSRAT